MGGKVMNFKEFSAFSTTKTWGKLQIRKTTEALNADYWSIEDEGEPSSLFGESEAFNLDDPIFSG